MFDPFMSHLAPYRPHLLSILRIVTALLFLEHATVKLFGFTVTDAPSAAALTFFWWIGVLELVGSVLLVIGWWTRLAAFVLSGEMAVAYFMAHAPHSFFPIQNGGEAAILFCFIFLYIAAAGPGAWAIDSRAKSS